MLIDGKCINLVNIWRKHDINAADDMILVLKKVVPEEYTLSRASGNTQRFSNLPTNHPVDGQGPVNLEERRMDGVWQLVPWIYNRADEPEVASEYDYRDNGYWHICKALQMFPSDPRFSYDKYNDMTKYRTTGELMEVSFQPRFKEGVPNGSSRMVIRKRDNYPMDREQNGIGSNLIPDQRNISGVSLGPSPAAWKAYLEKKKVISDRKRARDHIDTEEYSFNPRGGAFGQEDVPQPMEDQAPIEQPQNPIDQQQIQDPIEQSPDPPPTQSSRPSKKQSKTPKSSGMGLSSSYVPQSGQSASGIMGSVRASLLSSNDQGGGADTGDSST